MIDVIVLGSNSQRQRRQMHHKTRQESPGEANAAYTLPRRFVVVARVRPCHHRCNCPLPVVVTPPPLSDFFQPFHVFIIHSSQSKRTRKRRVLRRNLQICRKTKKPLRTVPRLLHALHPAAAADPWNYSQPYFLLQRMTCIPFLNQLSLSTSFVCLHTAHAS
jgi:hypothetical protein